MNKTKKAYRKTLKRPMPLWRVTVTPAAGAVYVTVFYVVKFPVSLREAAIKELLAGLERMTGVKFEVISEGGTWYETE